MRFNQENEEWTSLPRVPDRIFPNGGVVTTLLVWRQNSPLVCVQFEEDKKKKA